MAEDEDIHERTFPLAMRILKLVCSLPHDPPGSAIARQLARNGTAVGANVEEAQGSHSRKEFIRRMNIARSEVRETLYSPRLVAETEMLVRGRLREIVPEADESVRTLTAIAKRSRSHE